MTWIHFVVCIYLTMGSLFSMLVSSPRNQQAMQSVSPPSIEEKKAFTDAEKELPVMLGSTMQSFSPPSKEWKKTLTDDEKERLLLLGTSSRLESKPVLLKYKEIFSRIGDSTAR